MSETAKQEFLTSIPNSNAEWAAQEILNNFPKEQSMELQVFFDKLDKILFKSWAKDMTFSELHEAVEIARRFS